MFLLLPFFKPVYYIFMTYSCTSTTHLRPLWNLEPQCLISLCITMPYPNPSISIHIHRHIYIYIYPSYPSNHIYQIMSISIVRSVNIHRIHDFHHINISTNQSIYIYILIYVYIYLFIYLSCPTFCSALGFFASGGLALDLGFRLVSNLETKAPKHHVIHSLTKHTKTYSKEVGKQSSELQTHLGHFATWWLRKWWPREVVA